MMKKLIALCLAVLMTALCAFSLAEAPAAEKNTISTVLESEAGKFEVSFDLPEGAEVLSKGWEEGNLFAANIKLGEGQFLYLSVDASGAADGGDPVTYNEAAGYTDEKLMQMIDDLFGVDEIIVDKQVLTTAYGTKIPVVRYDTSAYAWSKWNNFEIGVTLTNVDGEGNFLPIPDDQLQRMTAFLSEVWMHMEIAAPDAEGKDESAGAEEEEASVLAWLTQDATEAEMKEILAWDLDTIKEKLKGYTGELKYHTADELAEELYDQMQLMNAFMGLAQMLDQVDLSEQIYAIEPQFDFTKWVGENQTISIMCHLGDYVVDVGTSFQDEHPVSYYCTLTDDLTLTSTGLKTEDSVDTTQGAGHVFTVTDVNDTNVLVWKDAEGKEVSFQKMDERYIGRFQSLNHVMEIAWQDGMYKAALAQSFEDIANGKEELIYLCSQGFRADNLNAYGTGEEGRTQADEGYCAITEDNGTLTFTNYKDIEETFNRVAE